MTPSTTMTTISTSRRSSSSPSSGDRLTVRLDAVDVQLLVSTQADGDVHPDRVPVEVLADRRRALVDLPWTMLAQRHGTDVVRVTVPGEHDGTPGDVAITDLTGAVLGCWTADCAPIVLASEAGEVAAVHAGWRGLAAGVVDAACDAFRVPPSVAVLGPTIGPCCYEFGRDDLALVAAGVGVRSHDLTGRTSAGTPALDMAAAVAAACRRRDIAVTTWGGCTGCAHPGFSHRVRRDPDRHVLAVWTEAR